MRKQLKGNISTKQSIGGMQIVSWFLNYFSDFKVIPSNEWLTYLSDKNFISYSSFIYPIFHHYFSFYYMTTPYPEKIVYYAQRARDKLVFDSIHRAYERKFSVIEENLKSSLFLTNSNFMKKYVIDYFRAIKCFRQALFFESNMEVLFPPVREEFLRKMSKKEETILLLSRFAPVKNFVFFLKSINDFDFLMFLKKSGWKIKICGGLDKHFSHVRYFLIIKKLVERLNRKVEAKIIDLNTNLSFEDVVEEFRTSSIFVHPAFYEHFGLVCAEALASRNIVVTTKTGGPWIDIIQQGKYGYGANSSHELRETLRFVIENYEECRKEKLKGVGSYVEKFRERNLRRQLERMINKKFYS